VNKGGHVKLKKVSGEVLVLAPTFMHFEVGVFEELFFGFEYSSVFQFKPLLGAFFCALFPEGGEGLLQLQGCFYGA
jgi:hypothetical protein